MQLFNYSLLGKQVVSRIKTRKSSQIDSDYGKIAGYVVRDFWEVNCRFMLMTDREWLSKN